MAKVAFIGLGVMGFPMAGHLKVKGGHDVKVYNRTTAKAETWVATFGGSHGLTPAEAADGADFVFTCVGNDDDLRSVTIAENGVIAAMKPGAVLIDNTTASAEVARELAAATASKGCGFIDAPSRAARPVRKTASSRSCVVASLRRLKRRAPLSKPMPAWSD